MQSFFSPSGWSAGLLSAIRYGFEVRVTANHPTQPLTRPPPPSCSNTLSTETFNVAAIEDSTGGGQAAVMAEAAAMGGLQCQMSMQQPQLQESHNSNLTVRGRALYDVSETGVGAFLVPRDTEMRVVVLIFMPFFFFFSFFRTDDANFGQLDAGCGGPI